MTRSVVQVRVDEFVLGYWRVAAMRAGLSLSEAVRDAMELWVRGEARPLSAPRVEVERVIEAPETRA